MLHLMNRAARIHETTEFSHFYDVADEQYFIFRFQTVTGAWFDQ